MEYICIVIFYGYYFIELYILLDDFFLWGWLGFRLVLIRLRNVYDFKVSIISFSFFFMKCL